MMRMLAATALLGLALGASSPTFAAGNCGTGEKTPAAKAATDCVVEAAIVKASPLSTAKANSEVGAALKDAIQRSQSFVHKYQAASKAGAPTFILLHGSGGNETSLMDLARKVAPNAAILGIRGRVVQDGINRWYRRLTPTTFDQADVKSEADAFASFMSDAQKQYKIDLKNAIFLGYSNGANLLAALSVLHPELVTRAALLRPMQVLKAIPDVKLNNASFLTVAGKEDATYGPFAPGLDEMLREHGAKVDAETIGLGHLLGDADVSAVSAWLSGMNGKPQAEPATVSASAQ